MKLIVTYLLVFIVPGAILEFDPEKASCMLCVASGDTQGAHAQACCANMNLCCNPSEHTSHPWGYKFSPGVCDSKKCIDACTSQRPGTKGNCDREVNFCECLGSDGQCQNCKNKPGKCDETKCNTDCISPSEHPLSVKGKCNRSNNYCECYSKEDRCLNC